MGALSKDGSVHVTDERINTISALAGVLLALGGVPLLILRSISSNDIWSIVAVSIYSFSVLMLFSMSTLHHGLNSRESVNKLFRILDYAAIYLLIAGTATALILLMYRTNIGWTILGSLWGIGALGIVLSSTLHRLPKHVSNTFFIIMGWLPVLLLLLQGVHFSTFSFGLLITGGLIYSAGFVLYAAERPNYKPGIFGFHELWHCFVLVAAILHFIFIYTIIR